jgi:outer membrane protein OmpA-like peptidoglycan-associated protein/Tol biopolymer transport system component
MINKNNIKTFHMYRSVFLIFIAVSLFTGRLFSQNVDFEKKNFPNDKKGLKEALKDLSAGDDLYDAAIVPNSGNYTIALDHYLKAQLFNPNNAMLNYRIGRCYLNSYDKSKAAVYLESALKLDPKVDKNILFQLGLAYHLNYQFDDAIKEYTAYKESLTPEELKKYSKDIDKKIEESNTAKELVKNPVRVFIDNLGTNINTIYPEYSPIINADESVMFFTSRRESTTGGEKAPDDMLYYEDIYISYNNNGIWSQAINPGKPLNTDKHDATVGLSPDGQTLLIFKGTRGGDIYQCKLNGKTWGKPKALPKVINSRYHESSATFGPDGRTLYFVSDKPGGFGGRDIYMSKMNDKGKWQEAVNLGPTINTEYDEEGVFMHPDGKTLYFSSQGHKTMGGYDIFKSIFENGKWSEPENLGYPINTTDNDVFFSISGSGLHGYYSSAMAGGIGEKDIYMVTILGPEKPVISNNEDNLLASLTKPVKETVIEPTVEIKSNKLTLLKGTIIDDVSSNPLKATIELTDNVKNDVIASFESNSATGKYLVSLPSGVNYGIAVKADGYLFHSENFDIPAATGYNEISKDFRMKKIEVGNKIVLNNIFFDFDKSTIRSESTAELDRLTKMLSDMPSLKIEISGHTDNIGNAAYNKTLSENRAKSVVDYLVNKGINANRLTFVGYGFDQPIATNDTEEGRQKNRRTEFKVVSK